MELAEKEEIDTQFKAIPPHPLIKIFREGVMHLKQWAGMEAKRIEQVFITLLPGAVHPHIVKVSRVLLDFIYLTSYMSHSTDILKHLQEALNKFHTYKDVFVRLGQRKHFNFPKMHSLQHYVSFIYSLGSADGYSTELPK
jgi:hypothetical protein